MGYRVLWSIISHKRKQEGKRKKKKQLKDLVIGDAIVWTSKDPLLDDQLLEITCTSEDHIYISKGWSDPYHKSDGKCSNDSEEYPSQIRVPRPGETTKIKKETEKKRSIAYQIRGKKLTDFPLPALEEIMEILQGTTPDSK